MRNISKLNLTILLYFFLFLVVIIGNIDNTGARELSHQAIQLTYTPVVGNKNLVLSYTESADTDWFVNAWGTPEPNYNLIRHSRISNESRYNLEFVRGRIQGNGNAHLIFPYKFDVNSFYTVRILLKSNSNARVRISLRNDEIPYQSFAIRTINLTNEWQEYSVSGINAGSEGSPTSVRVILLNEEETVNVGGIKIYKKENYWKNYEVQNKINQIFSGLVINRLGVHNNWPNFDISILRLWDTATDWRSLQPDINVWDSNRLDYYVRFAKEHNAEILLTLGQTPPWAVKSSSLRSGCAYGTGCLVPDKNAWRAYIRKIANMYKDDITYWELWNEPDYSGFWRGSVSEFVELAKIAYEEIKAANSEAIIIGPAITAPYGLNFLEEFLFLGGSKYLDAISFHAYYSSNFEHTLAKVANIRETLRYYNLSHLPLWNTEGAPPYENALINLNINEKVNEWTAAQGYLVMFGLGLENFTYYKWENKSYLSNLTDPPFYRDLSIVGKNYAEIVSWLKNAQLKDFNLIADNYILEVFREDSNYVILWRNGEAKAFLKPDEWIIKKIKTGRDVWSDYDNNELLMSVEPMILKMESK